MAKCGGFKIGLHCPWQDVGKYTICQIFISNPRSGRISGADKKIQYLRGKCFFVHSAYTARLWSAEFRHIAYGEAKLAHECRALGYVLHLPTYPGVSDRVAIKRTVGGLGWLMKRVPGIKLLLEPPVQHDSIWGNIGNCIELMKLARAKYGSRVGFVFDTAHSWSMGVNPVNVRAWSHIPGLSLVHFNGSCAKFGGYRDLHAVPGEASDNIYKTRADLLEVVDVIKLNNIPIIVEAGLKNLKQYNKIKNLIK